MKSIKKYCNVCEKKRKHFQEKQEEGGYRVFAFIFTLGMFEGLNKTIQTCSKCGNKNLK